LWDFSSSSCVMSGKAIRINEVFPFDKKAYQDEAIRILDHSNQQQQHS